jgi:hypothetical protein
MSKKRVLLISSGGGHWRQLLRLIPAVDENEVGFATVDPESASDVPGHKFYRVPDCNRNNITALLHCAIVVSLVCLRFRPDVVITTGAAPGYLAVRIGRFLGARSLFLDSIANAEQLSMSAQLAIRSADVTLTQWSHLADERGPRFEGAVL